MQTRRLGDLEVGAIGMGAMPLSHAPRPDEERALATVHAALDAGVTLFDTADAYAIHASEMGHGEELLTRALTAYRGDADVSRVVIATKGGHTRTPDDGWGLNGTRAYLRSAAEASARRLGVDAIALYQFHRPDPETPWAESIGALKELHDDGLIVRAGISNANPDQIREAHTILGDALVSVQNELSPAFRTSLPEVDVCDELGLAFLPWSPFGGLGDAPQFAAIARERGVSPQQVCLAWLLARSDRMIPIPGSSRPETIRDSAAATHLALTADELARLG
jgi:aryl-alcohol dehydrogenase-like predicted oxidoreductase